MNTSTSPTIKRPCAAWANSLAADPDDLTATERAALDAHVATCEACAAARADYTRMDAMIRGLPAPAPLKSLPAYPSDRRPEDDTQDTATRERVAPPTNFISGMATRRRSQLSPQWAAFRAIAAVLVVSVVVAGFAALLSHRQSGGPNGLQPHVGHWRLIAHPPGVPTETSGFNDFAFVPQTSVPGLIYACWAPRTADDTHTPITRQMWRSEDAGRTWKPLTAPAVSPTEPLACYLQVSPGAPNTVFLNILDPNGPDIAVLFSLDRGEHWQRMTPLGEPYNGVGAPEAEGDVWYYDVSGPDGQRELRVSRDHGAHWVSHGYPVRFPTPGVNDAPPGVGPTLQARYEKGGLLFLIQRTLWWTPDYGTTWQNLGVWGAPPCNRVIIGTPDLAVLYCLKWFRDGRFHSPWRSLDHGQTWQQIPYWPAATHPSEDPVVTNWGASLLLRDGSLLKMSAETGDGHDIALYSLAPHATVWRRASEALYRVPGLCRPAAPGETWPDLCLQFTMESNRLPYGLFTATLADGPNGTQTLYTSRVTDGEIVAAEITWT